MTDYLYVMIFLEQTRRKKVFRSTDRNFQLIAKPCGIGFIKNIFLLNETDLTGFAPSKLLQK